MALGEWLQNNSDNLGTFLRYAGQTMQGRDASPILARYMAMQEMEKEKAAEAEGRKQAGELVQGVLGWGRTGSPSGYTSPNRGGTTYSARNAAMDAYGGPTNAAASALSQQDRDLLAKTLMAEAGGEGLEGMLAAGSVINNRVGAGGYGDTLQDVIMKPGQFSAWNSVTGYAGGEGGLDMANMTPSQEAYQVADMILSGNYQDPTGGATHYYNPSVESPNWGQRAGGDWIRS
jgi:spore germination cell wall hydrolase CwlJ-like protein